MTNLILTLGVALAALYAAERLGWLPDLGHVPAHSDTTRSLEITDPISQPAALAAVALPEAPLDTEGAAAPSPFQEALLEPAPTTEGSTDPISGPAAESELDAAPALPEPVELAEPDRSAALVRRMLSLYRRGGERR